MTRKEHEKRLKKINSNLDQEINDKYKHVADTITDGFRNFFLGSKKEKGGFGWYGKEKADKELNELYTLPALRLPDEKPQLKDLTDRNKALENKNAKLEGELSAYRQMLNQMLNILSKEHKDEN